MSDTPSSALSLPLGTRGFPPKSKDLGSPKVALETSLDVDESASMSDTQDVSSLHGERPLGSHRGKLTTKAILKRKQRKRRRMYKFAWKMLMDKIENISEDSDSSNDLLSDFSDQAGELPVLTRLHELHATPATEVEDVPSESQPARVSVVHRAELYRYVRTSNYQRKPELEKSFEDKAPIQTIKAEETTQNSSSVYEVTTMYAIPRSGDYGAQSFSLPLKVTARLQTYLTIRSPFILEAMRDIIKYYPRISLHNDPFIIMEPFCLLLHYKEELVARRNLLKEQSKAEEPSAASTADGHLTLLIDHLSERYDEALISERARHKRATPTCTFEWIWLLYKPGTTVYTWDDDTLVAYVVLEHDREMILRKDEKIRPPNISMGEDPDVIKRPKTLRIQMWNLEFDGDHIGRCLRTMYISPFDGEKVITTLPVFPKEFLLKDKLVHPVLTVEAALIERGKSFFDLTNRSYRQYQGETVAYPKRVVRGRIMVDTKYYFDNVSADSKKVFRVLDDPEAMELDLMEERPKGLISNSWYGHYDNIKPTPGRTLEDAQYIICSDRVWGFVLKTREWWLLSVSGITEPDLQTNLIDDLVLKPEAKSMIKALSKAYTVQKGPGGRFSADFVRNKGEGQIFLLHGKPGVGKTTTAECVAELTQRPLLSLTCGDLGISPLEVESALMKWLKLATLWEAILLLDEADVYLESRLSQDLQRNSLVSIFLRALEYYQGILFLTTNRVGSFDDGFTSRIHVIIHYPDFDDKQRGQIWDIFFKKLERERENVRVTQRAVDYAKDSAEVKALGWNGREIRNAFNTAVALAEFENEQDAKGNVMLQQHHLEQVVKMSRSFQDYIEATLRMKKDIHAHQQRLRADAWRADTTLHL